jgi:hypothetical protein
MYAEICLAIPVEIERPQSNTAFHGLLVNRGRHAPAMP